MKNILAFRASDDNWLLKLNGITEFARQQDWKLLVIEADLPQSKIRELLNLWNPAGVIVDDQMLTPNIFKSIPSVFFDRSPDLLRKGLTIVRHASSDIARLATLELLNLNYPDYAFLGWFRKTYWMEDKRRTFAELMKLHGKRIHEFYPEGCTDANSPEFHRQLRRWIATLPKPCGIYGVTDSITAHAVSIAAALGIAIPEEIAIIGSDDNLTLCESLSPTLSSVRADFHTAGFRAAELLHKQLTRNDCAPQLCVVQPLRVIRRQSTRLLKKSNPTIQKALEFIRREATSGLTANQVIETIPGSRRMAEIRFRESVGHSILQEIQSIRFDSALELLKNPSISITAIADRSGWTSLLQLERYVQGTHGRSMTQLRREISRTSSSAQQPFSDGTLIPRGE